jgi:hypothetical protein
MPDTVPKQPLKKCSIQVTTNRLPKRIELGKNRSDSKNGNVNERLNQFSPMVCRATTGTAIRGLPLKNPRPMDAADEAGHPKGQTMNMECSLYRRPGKPQRAMAEIRRMLLQKISGQIEKEGLPGALMESSSVRRRVNK